MVKNNKVVKYKKPIHINLGAIIFTIIFIYLAVQVFLYFNSEQLAVYEVNQNKIAEDNTYQGLILREETIVNSTKAGYINYYTGEASRISKNSTVYTVDETGDMYELLAGTEQDETLTKDEISQVRKSIASMRDGYNGSNYGKVYSYKYDIENIALELADISTLTTLNQVLEESGKKNSFSVIKSNKSGIVSYIQDGFEGVTVNKITEEMFDTSEYKKTQLRSTEKKEAGSPVYKLVTSEKWSVVVPLATEQYDALKEKTSVKVMFLEDEQQANASISFIEKDGKQYGVLQFSNFMLRYLSNRYINLEILANSETGYKVPRTAVTTKEFYKIPIAYFTKGGDNDNTGIVKLTYTDKGEEKTQFIEASTLYQDEDFGYIDTALIQDKDIIINPASTGQQQEKFQVSETIAVQGVYNVNKGYPVFKRIEVLYENSEYYLLAMDTSNGVNNYDHIILNAEVAKELNYID